MTRLATTSAAAGAPLEESPRPEPVERRPDERTREAAEQKRHRLRGRDLTARAAELGDQREVENGEGHEDTVMGRERHRRNGQAEPGVV